MDGAGGYVRAVGLEFALPDEMLSDVISSGEWVSAAHELASALDLALPGSFGEGLLDADKVGEGGVGGVSCRRAGTTRRACFENCVPKRLVCSSVRRIPSARLTRESGAPKTMVSASHVREPSLHGRRAILPSLRFGTS